MRMRVGDWERVLQMTKDNSGYDHMTAKTHDELGKQYSEQLKWEKAALHFRISNNYEGLAEVYFRGEDFENLDKLVNDLPEGH
jgi:hypothetical protein